MSTPSEPQPPVETAGPKKTGTQEIPVQPVGAHGAQHPGAHGAQHPGAHGAQHPGAHGATAVQQLPPHPAATTPTPVPASQPADGPQPTGPVDFVLGLPGVGTQPPPPPPPARPAGAIPPPAAQPGPHTSQHAAPHAQPAGPVWPETLESDGAAAGSTRPKRRPRVRGPQDRAALIGLGLVGLSLALLELGLLVGFDGDSYWTTVPLWSAFATVCVLLGLLVFAAFYRAGNRSRSGPAWRLAAGGLVGLAVFWLLVVLPVVASDRGFVLTAALGALGGALWIGPRRKD